jgi:hypothetical protein
MEIKRKAEELRFRLPPLRWLWTYLNAYSLYRRFSRYGTSYMVALGWLFGWVVVIFPLTFMFSGFSVIDTSTGKAVAIVQYQMYPDFSHLGRWLSDWSKAISFSLSIATFQRSRLFDVRGELTYLLTMIESIAVAGQSALMLFAIRRRFKR